MPWSGAAAIAQALKAEVKPVSAGSSSTSVDSTVLAGAGAVAAMVAAVVAVSHPAPSPPRSPAHVCVRMHGRRVHWGAARRLAVARAAILTISGIGYAHAAVVPFVCARVCASQVKMYKKSTYSEIAEVSPTTASTQLLQV